MQRDLLKKIISILSLIIAFLSLVTSIAITGVNYPEVFRLVLSVVALLFLAGTGGVLVWQAAMTGIRQGKHEYKNGLFMSATEKWVTRVASVGLSTSCLLFGLAGISMGILAFLLNAIPYAAILT